jgi:hypothetical protein
MWDNISANSARWQPAFSFDGGVTRDTNWIAEYTRQLRQGRMTAPQMRMRHL